MTYERSEYAAQVAEKQTAQMNGQRSNLEVMYQQAVRGELLTGDEHWDAFLTYIQSAIDHTQKQAEGYRSALEAPNMVDANEIMATKISLIAANNRIVAWNAVLQLPKDLKEQGEKAQDLLSRLDG